jgi:uncharacterized protein
MNVYTCGMSRTNSPLPKTVCRLPSGRVPRSAIRRYVDQVVARFHPEKVILFGSHAYGKPNVDSDVDLLVVMPAYDMINQSIRISVAIDAPFPLDLIVRTREYLAKRLSWNDWFLREIDERGIVLYDFSDKRMAIEGRGGRANRSARNRRQAGLS